MEHQKASANIGISPFRHLPYETIYELSKIQISSYHLFRHDVKSTLCVCACVFDVRPCVLLAIKCDSYKLNGRQLVCYFTIYHRLVLAFFPYILSFIDQSIGSENKNIRRHFDRFNTHRWR